MLYEIVEECKKKKSYLICILEAATYGMLHMRRTILT